MGGCEILVACWQICLFSFIQYVWCHFLWPFFYWFAFIIIILIIDVVIAWYSFLITCYSFKYYLLIDHLILIYKVLTCQLSRYHREPPAFDKFLQVFRAGFGNYFIRFPKSFFDIQNYSFYWKYHKTLQIRKINWTSQYLIQDSSHTLAVMIYSYIYGSIYPIIIS